MTTTTPTTTTLPRFPVSMRKALLVTHIIASVSWIGVDLALWPLLYAANTSGDPLTVAGALKAISILVPATVPVLSLTLLGTGVLLGLGTTWGLIRYWWVLAKLALSVVMTVLVFTALVPTVVSIELQAAAGVSADAIRAGLGPVLTGLIFPPVVSFGMLVGATILSVFKPWRRTPWSR